MRKNYVIVTSRHHRKMRGHGGGTEKENISIVPHHKHVAFHTLFGNMNTFQIVEYLNKVWIDPKKQLVIVNL